MKIIDTRTAAAPGAKTEAAAAARALAETVDRHEDGSVRRIGPGHRTASDFFAPDKQRRELTRGDVVNLFAMIEYARAESRWHRKIWRWLHHVPQVINTPAALVRAHQKTLDEVKERLTADLAEKTLALRKREAERSLEAEAGPSTIATP